MARRINVSQLKSELRRIENKQRQAIENYNRQVRQHNNAVRQFVNRYNAAVDRYNSAVRQHNAKVQHNRQIVQREIRKLNQGQTVTVHRQYTSTLRVMQTSYAAINDYYDEGVEISPEQEHILDLVDKEQLNSLITTNMVFDDQIPQENTEDVEIGNKLILVSQDLLNRWKGAVFSLNPNNPDAARHFCTSTRELFTEFIELKASDADVFAYNPMAEKTERGNATRKEKIRYMMRNSNMDSSVIDFADADITNILELFHILSDGTHGAAGKYEYNKLMQVKRRVEQGINFLCEIAS